MSNKIYLLIVLVLIIIVFCQYSVWSEKHVVEKDGINFIELSEGSHYVIGANPEVYIEVGYYESAIVVSVFEDGNSSFMGGFSRDKSSTSFMLESVSQSVMISDENADGIPEKKTILSKDDDSIVVKSLSFIED